MAVSPSPEVFVAKLAAEPAKADADRGADPGADPDLEMVEADGSTLAVIRMAPSRGGDAGDVRDTWRRLNAEDRFEWVAPAMVDDDGEAHLPTGQITVRFAEPPDPERIERFAARHDLRVDHRNELSPRQVVFAPCRPGSTYLPEMAEAAGADREVAAAWPNTMSRFEREAIPTSGPTSGPAPGEAAKEPADAADEPGEAADEPGEGTSRGRSGRAAKRRR